MTLDRNSLKIVNTDSSGDGLALRFQQYYAGFPVDGAEVVALFDSSGNLDVLNAAIENVTGISTKPSIGLKQAVQFGAVSLGISQPELAPNENGELRIAQGNLVWQFAIRNADGSRAHRVQVIASGFRAGEVIKSLSFAQDIANITIYDASVSVVVPNPIFKGVKVLENGKKVGLGRRINTDEAEHANASMVSAASYYLNVFKRDSFDGKSAPLVAAINANRHLSKVDPLGMRQNAAWMGPWKMFVFGSGGDMLGSFAESLDVVGHEFTHAVISSTSNLEYAGQSGALNEHLADVFGATIEEAFEHPKNPFLMGEKCLRGALAAKAEALRDMLYPHKSLGGQPAHMSEIPAEDGEGCIPSNDNDNCGVHGNNGVPNRAGALIIQQLGFQAAAPLFYRVMTVRLRTTSDFADYRNQMMDECATRRGARMNCDVIRKAFADVGL